MDTDRRGGDMRAPHDVTRMKTPPAHPGELLLNEFLEPRGISQRDFARRLGVSYSLLNDVIRAHRSVSADLALRLSLAFQTSPQFWLSLQQDWDLWQAWQRKGGEIGKLHSISDDREGRDGN